MDAIASETMMISILLLALLAADGTTRCDSARRAAIRAVEAAWMVEPEPFVAGSSFISTPCSCGDCMTTLQIGPAMPPGPAYYECKLAEAKERQAAQERQEQAARDQAAREDAAREAMYRVRDACGEGPKRPAPVKWEFSTTTNGSLLIGGSK